REYGIGVFAEPRRRLRRQAHLGREIERQPRYQIAPDPGLVDHREERVRLRAASVVAHQLHEILELAPQHAGAGKSLSYLVKAAARAPSREHSGDDVARLIAPGLGIEIDIQQGPDHRQPLAETGRLAYRAPLPTGQRDN